MARLIFDVETDGLLPTLTRIHTLVAYDVDTDETFVYRRNDKEDTIAEGLEKLLAADELIGHNIIGFDLKAIKKVYPDFDYEGRIHDTLVTVRNLPIDFKDRDFKLNKAGRLPSKFIGKHSLDSWGYRVGLRKGDYASEMVKKGLDPWAAWNQDMEDYCVQDVRVNHQVWKLIDGVGLSQDVVDMEQDMQSLVTYMEQQGYPFDQAEALKLADDLRSQMEDLVASVSEGICGRFVADKKHVVKPIWIDPDGLQESKTYKPPREEWGEDLSRAVWADITIPKKDSKTSDPTKRGDRTEGAAYSKIKWKEFSPTSRDQIRELLTERYNWKPTEWTDTGMPSVDDTVLRGLADTVPFANDLADIFLIQKILGYLVNGQEAWTKKYNPETGKIHPYINIGGTVTGRCSHHGPNIGQVPALQVDKVKGVMLGKEGGWGAECRRLFYTPTEVNGRPWRQVGVDLSGIEYRMLAENTAEFDGGELINVILSGTDIHDFNMEKTGITERSVVKRLMYALLYGAGDPKLGLTAAPEADPSTWAEIGRRARAQIMDGLPALAKVIEKYKRQAEKGYIIGLDGRKLSCRSPHSSLNTKLQSDGALVAKRWAIFTEEYAMEDGFDHGWDGDFVILAFVHDELQNAVAADRAEEFAKLCVEAAKDSGESFNLTVPIGAEYKIGQNWAECH